MSFGSVYSQSKRNTPGGETVTHYYNQTGVAESFGKY